MPFLKELLDLSLGKVKLHIELKDEAAVEAVVQLIESKKMGGEVFLTSGNTEVLKKVRSLNRSISTEQIFGVPPEDALEITRQEGESAFLETRLSWRWAVFQDAKRGTGFQDFGA